jgi:hypothetical protein
LGDADDDQNHEDLDVSVRRPANAGTVTDSMTSARADAQTPPSVRGVHRDV